MIKIEQSLFIRSLKRQPVERTPVWLMRQAGRYLPEYRQVRAQAGDFLNLCKNPELACEVTLQPLRRFSLDAAILFSDILTIPDAMGLGLYFEPGEGPCFKHPVRTEKNIQTLRVPDPEQDLGYVGDAVALIRREMPEQLPLIGFAGSPWTLACYMVEGKSTRQFNNIIDFMYTKPVWMHKLLSILSRSVSQYLDMQVQRGVNALMIFDTWGGILSTSNYQQFSLDYMSNIVQNLKEKHPDIPVILFTKGGAQWLPLMAQSGCDAIGVDWMCDLRAARRAVGDKVALQGNLDPAVLRTNPECIRMHVKEVLAAYGNGTGHIFNLGHGVTPDVPPEHVQVMVEAVQAFSPEYHKQR